MINMNHQSLIKKFDKQAKKYENRRKHDQAYNYRQRIFREAKGKVLEVAIGTGLNFPFYNRDIELIGLDFSREMLNKAHHAAKDYQFKTTLLQNDVETVDFKENSFDTIISSASLCAYQSPINVLNNFQKWCKQDGQILMLEHGLSTNKPLALFQKAIDPFALRLVGCHQNRNISEIVNKSKLKVIKEERYFAGYLYLIWAKP